MARTLLDQLTDKQEVFRDLVVDGISPTKAAEQAGFAHPAQAAHALMRNPKVAAAIDEAARRHLSIATGSSVKTLVRLQDEKYPPAVQLGAAKAVLERAWGSEKTSDNKGKDAERPLMEMTETELAETLANVDRLRSSLHNALHPNVIEHHPIDIIEEDTTPSA